MRDRYFVSDTELSPIDVAIGPDQNLYVSSEYPFGATDAIGTVRCYDLRNGALLRVYDAGVDAQGQPRLSRPRGIGFGRDGYLYVNSSGNGRVIRFAVNPAAFQDVFVSYAGLFGQGLNFVPHGTAP